MEAEIKFEPEGRIGVIAIGSYLYDAAKRLGIDIPECERRACQAKVVAVGEIVVMAEKKKQTTEEEKKSEERKKVEEFRKEFDEMPLEKKIAALLELEAVALGETFSFVLNSPYHIFDKVMGVMAEFGLKMDKENKEAKTPDEHKAKEEKAESNGGAAKGEAESAEDATKG